MKNEMIRLALAMTALGTVLLSLSCRTGVENQNANTTPALATSTNASPSPTDDTCVGTPTEKVKKIDEAINDAINQDEKLKSQRDSKKFSISVSPEPNTSIIAIRVKGRVAGGGKLKDFVGLFDKYLKKGCVHIVKFESTTTTTAFQAQTGFYWILCEDPMILCKNGECATSCDLLGSEPYNIGQLNSTVNTNSNSNKGNTNRP